jgi:hypothetical protein
MMEYGIYIGAYLVTIIVGHLCVRLILSRYRPVFGGGLPGAGALIGVLERVLTLTFVLIGEYTAIALIFAAKSIARFEELKNRNFAEYYLIGSLTSIMFSLLVGLITRHLLNL